jgi:CheY-like chemotaxis protein
VKHKKYRIEKVWTWLRVGIKRSIAPSITNVSRRHRDCFLHSEKERETIMKKILLVDNNREYRHAMATIVRRVGYDVIQAEEIAEAIERSVSDRPDLVMMGDGVETAARLDSNQFRFSIPIVIYTAQRTASWIDAALSNGAAAVLTKPISSADVREVLGKHLHASRNRPRPIPSPCFVNAATL